MKPSKRNQAIDFLRGLAVLLIVLIHVTYYFRSDPLARFLWEYSQFAVTTFVFCSAYIYFKRDRDDALTFMYFFKRLKRLLVPYYIFLIVFSLYSLVFRGNPLDGQSVVNRTLLLNHNSRDLEWLIVLFVSFMFLMPLIRFLSKKTWQLWLFALVGFTAAVYLLFASISIPFRLIMWLPWSITLVMTYLLVQHEHHRWFFPSVLTKFLGIVLITRGVLLATSHSLTLVDNKYPPNLYYLSYGIFVTFLLYYLYQYIPVKNTWANKAFDFLSAYSYSIFFIHFLILYAVIDFAPYKTMPWWGVFTGILGLSVGVQILLNKISQLAATRNS